MTTEFGDPDAINRKYFLLFLKFNELIKLCGPLVSRKIDDLQKEFAGYLENNDFSKTLSLVKRLKKEYKVENGDDIISYFETVASTSFSTEKIDNTRVDDEKIEALLQKFNEGAPEKQTILLREKVPYEETKRITETLIRDKLQQDNKLIFPFIVSENFKKRGKISNKITMKTPYSLLSVSVKKDLDQKNIRVGYIDSKQEMYNAERYIDYLYTYYFVSYDEDNTEDTMEYTLLSRELLPLEEVVVHGMKIPIVDTIKLGSSAKIPKGFEMVYVTSYEKAVKEISFDEFKELTAKYKNNYELLYSDYFGKFRHPPIFEKFLLGWLFASECSYGPVNSYKPNLGIIGPSRGGKSVILDCLSTVFKEHKHGEASTIKGYVPSFGGVSRPDPGKFLKARRFCIAEEFLNTATKSNDLTVLDTLKSLLVHDTTEASSGKFEGSNIYGTPTATFVFASNFIKPKMENFVSLANTINPAVLARFIIYIQSEEHVNYIKERQKELTKNKKEGVSKLLPTSSNQKIAVYDFLLKKRVEFGDFNEFDIVEDVKQYLPDNPNIREIYNGANEHVVKLIDGVTKLNYILEGRDGEITVTKKDFEETREIWRYIINSWNGDILRLPINQKLQFLTRNQKIVFEFIHQSDGVTKADIDAYMKESCHKELTKLLELRIIEVKSLGNTNFYYSCAKSRLDTKIDDNYGMLDTENNEYGGA